jgi:hypothetical protein
MSLALLQYIPLICDFASLALRRPLTLTMEQWEYKTLAWVYRNGGMTWMEDGKEIGSRDGSLSWLGTHLNQLGAVGWELVGVTNIADPQTNVNGPVHFLKRRLQTVEEKLNPLLGVHTVDTVEQGKVEKESEGKAGVWRSVSTEAKVLARKMIPEGRAPERKGVGKKETGGVEGKTETRAPEERNRVVLRVSNLSFDEDDASLAMIFKGIPLKGAHVARRPNGKSKGFGLIELADPSDVEKALKKNASEVRGRNIVVETFGEHM